LASIPAHADARHGDVSKISLQVLLLLAVLFGTNRALYADGGTLQFRKQAGPFTVTLFSMPVPLRVGAADLSILVQDAQNNALVDGSVRVVVTKAEEREIEEPATTAQATNKLLYAAQVELPRAGVWQVAIQATTGGISGTATGTIKVLPEEAPFEAFWIYFTVVPVGVLLFLLNQRLKRQQKLFKR
jgi:hypothetical protein